jgi:branched-chain amino acid transport system permease protein
LPGRAACFRARSIDGGARVDKPTPIEEDKAAIIKAAIIKAAIIKAARYRVATGTRLSRFATFFALALVVFFAALPAFGNRETIQDLFFLFTILTLAQFWNLLAGYAAVVSIGQQAFVGFGAYMLFASTILWRLDVTTAVALSGVLSGILALGVAFIVFRLHGPYLSIGTWVVAEVLRLLFAQWKQLGGGTGTSLPVEATSENAAVQWIATLFDIRSAAARDIFAYWLALIVVVATLVLIYTLLRTRWGLGLAAVRDNERGAESVGVDAFLMKLFVYVIAGFGTGLVGAIIYVEKARISPNAAFSLLDWTAYVIFIVVIGGIGTIEGPIVGAVVFYVLQTYLAGYGSAYLILLGGLGVATMLFAPKGIWGFVVERWNLQLFPVRRRLVATDKE